MLKIIGYVIKDLLRNRWTLFYFLFYLLVGFAILIFSGDFSKSMVSFLQIILILTPLIGTLFGVMYYYNSRDFIELLLAQPIRRRDVFIGQWLGVSISLGTSLVLGLGIPFLWYFAQYEVAGDQFVLLLLLGFALGTIFTGLSMAVSVSTDNKIRGFGYALVLWLLMAVVYDGFLLLALIAFRDYPLEKFALIATMFNPIDLARITILLKLDISALMGYTGAVFREFLGSTLGMITASFVLMLWVLLPFALITFIAKKRDF
ncbi:MAG: ABC transporter permease subunit [Chlorobi bacterium]|nr:ABC transporter permease subunit [Chlorobiota bacterium]